METETMTGDVLQLLAVYDGAGVASREMLEDAPPEYHPSKVMPDFQSVVVLASEPKNLPAEQGVGKFHRTLAMIAAQDAAMNYLGRRGYKAKLIGSRARNLNLPRIGERAGVGELSPVHTLAVEGHGLRTVLSAIITDAKLRQSPPATDACADRRACIRKCPALDAEGAFDRRKCTSCGACVKKCTV